MSCNIPHISIDAQHWRDKGTVCQRLMFIRAQTCSSEQASGGHDSKASAGRQGHLKAWANWPRAQSFDLGCAAEEVQVSITLLSRKSPNTSLLVSIRRETELISENNYTPFHKTPRQIYPAPLQTYLAEYNVDGQSVHDICDMCPPFVESSINGHCSLLWPSYTSNR
ncbi:hypothetical protein TNCV_1831071 [Trichonephila clavipes]|nr:hypothetical protein TNCV_1831071 [Trichonephila clavipes]